MTSEKITFMSSNNETLAARLDSPNDSPALAYALFAHCFACSKDLGAVNRIVRALNKERIAVFRFDFTGLGMSSGDFGNTNFSSNVEDLMCAADYMHQHLRGPDLMLGHSLGGTATLVAASQVPEVKAVATIGAPSNTTNVLKHFGGALDVINEQGFAEVELAGRTFTMKRQFVEDAQEQKVIEKVKALKAPLLIMHSPIDETVNIDHARELYNAANHPKSYISLDKADHLLMQRPSDGKYVARVLSAWASQYVEEENGAKAA